MLSGHAKFAVLMGARSWVVSRVATGLPSADNTHLYRERGQLYFERLSKFWGLQLIVPTHTDIAYFVGGIGISLSDYEADTS